MDTIRAILLDGRGYKNRTRTSSFGDCCSTIKLIPYKK